MLNPEEAFQQLLMLLDTVKNIEEEMKSHFEYSPFNYLAGKIKGEILDIRKKLISYAVEKYRKQYTPNIDPGVNFDKMMKEAYGELEFNEAIIKEWFVAQAQDPQQLSRKSLEQMIKTARSFVPYSSDGQEWGPLKDWRKIVSGNILILRCYSWSAYKSISYSLNGKGEFNALESVIAIVTLPGKDPATIKVPGWISQHIARKRQDPDAFYGRHTTAYPTVDAFQFFKNDKAKTWFKQREHAEAVAKTLTTGALVKPRAPSLLFVAS